MCNIQRPLKSYLIGYHCLPMQAKRRMPTKICTTGLNAVDKMGSIAFQLKLPIKSAPPFVNSMSYFQTERVVGERV